MDKRIVESKLESLRRCISRIEGKMPNGANELENDFDLQDIISVNLERAVQQCVDIGAHLIAPTENGAPSTMAEIFETLFNINILKKDTTDVMKRAVGFRNIAVHNYHEINWEIVFNICQNQLGDFKQFAKEINNYLAKG